MGKWTCLPHQGNYFPSRNPLLSSFSRSNIIIFSEDSFAFLLKLVPEIGPNLSCYNRWDFTLSFSYPFHHWLSFLTLSSRLPYNQRFCKMTPKEKAPVLRPAHFPFQVACSSQPATTWPRHRHCLCLQYTAMLAACCRQTIPRIHLPTPPPPRSPTALALAAALPWGGCGEEATAASFPVFVECVAAAWHWSLTSKPVMRRRWHLRAAVWRLTELMLLSGDGMCSSSCWASLDWV